MKEGNLLSLVKESKAYILYYFEELTHRKRLWCWEGLWAGGKGDDRGWDGWMASLTRWTWVWVNSRRRWWTGRPGVLQFMGSQRVRHDWATELNWTKYTFQCYSFKSSLPHLLPHSPKVCSLHLCLFCCFAHRIIITIFLNSIYVC